MWCGGDILFLIVVFDCKFISKFFQCLKRAVYKGMLKILLAVIHGLEGRRQ